ncbi:MAG: VWA domain-containing protein [Euryarchaeota archaeon]|nr:VWA domain-containing protein [Euryarchaeota archaeon]
MWRPPAKPHDIILDTDRSGSMSGQKIIDAKNAAKLFVDLLESQDQVGLVSFSSSATLDSSLTSDFEHAKSVIAGYSAGGSTNMGDALSKSIQELKTNGRDDTIWSIIYFTDGQTNAGLTKTEILDSLVPEAIDAGIIIYTLGYGSNVDEDFLRQVAEATCGKYYFAPDSAKLMEIYIELSQKIKGMEKIAEFTGTVSQGDAKIETFLLESKTSFMRTFLIWPGSDLDLTVIDPSGNQIIPGPGVIYSGNDALPEYYEIYDPQTGEWTIEVYGKDVAGATEDYTVMVFQPGALMQVKPTKWDVNYPLNRRMTFDVSEIAGNIDLTNITFTASDLTESIVTSTSMPLMKS